MKMLWFFIAYELKTQWRSMRFRGLAAIYVVASSVPAVFAYVIATRVDRVIGPPAFCMLILSLQPLLTALFAALLSVDALARERDEGSFGVLSVAAVSSSGYVLRRWLAIVAICIPITLVPHALGAALSIRSRYDLPSLAYFLGAWAVYILPALLVSSALAIALGTITGRTVLAIIGTAILFTFGVDMFNSLLFYVRHLRFDGPGELFAGGMFAITQLIWTIRGHWFPDLPSEAAFPLISESSVIVSRAGIIGALTIVLLAVTSLYLRRRKRDLRPWRISETHQLRTLLRTLNRFREEFTPDSGSGVWDRVAIVAALALAALAMTHLVNRQSMFASLAADRYEAEKIAAAPTSTALVAESTTIDGKISLARASVTRTVLTIRNTGTVAESHLSFELNALVAVKSVSIDRGTTKIRRTWQRLDVDVHPPIGAGESRQLVFELEGKAGEVDFALQHPGSFAVRWNRYRTAKEAIFMSDLSRSHVLPAATEARMNLSVSDIAPVLRYSPWTVLPPDEGDGFVREAITPVGAIHVRLRHPYSLAADSCGTLMSGQVFESRCRTEPGRYLLLGGPYTQRAIGLATSLVYFPAHERLASTHEASLLLAVQRATEAWPTLTLPQRILFVERPREANERRWDYEYAPWRVVRQIANGSIFIVPETTFLRTRAIDPSGFAAGIVSGMLSSRRRVDPKEADFFQGFYANVAAGRLGMRKGRAVDSGIGIPDTEPLLRFRYSYRVVTRMSRVLLAIEHRVGADRFVEGVNDFLTAGPEAGTAKELVDAIGRRGGVDLNNMYRDYFVGGALPQLTLEDVRFLRIGSRWDVTGAVRNAGTGEAFVPVVLRSASGSLWQTLRVGTGERAEFRWSFEGAPHSVQLDPDGVCYRHAAIGTIQNVEFRGDA